MLGDCTIKDVDEVRHSQVISFPEIHINELDQLITRDKIPEIHDKEILVLHVGTYDILRPFDTIFDDLVNLIATIRVTSPRLRIIWSQILPRPDCDDELNAKIIQFNNFVKFRAHLLQVNTIPSFQSLHRSTHPKVELFASDGVHLESQGTFLVRETFRQKLISFRRSFGMPVGSVQALPSPPTSIREGWSSLLI